MNIEPLETRIAPAAVFTFTDVDGDLVKITTTLGTNADLAAGVTEVGGQLRLLDLRAAVFQNTNVTASVVTKGVAGDGLVHIGRINASGRDLGNVTVSGDLSSIFCGDGITTTPGLDLLSVRSMGLYGTATQGGGVDLTSAVEGGFGALKVASDLKDVSIGARSFGTQADGRIGSVSIGGSLDGAYLFSTGNMGVVKIARDLLGGSAGSSGVISCGGKLGSLTIGGSVIGGSGGSTGEIYASELGTISIGHDVIGGSGAVSGTIQSGGKLTSLTVGGSLIGGLGQQLYNNGTQNVEGQIAVLGDIGTISIANNVVGGAGLNTARITGYGKIASISIGGSVIGGTGGHSAAIESAGDLTALRIGFDLKGGTGDESGKIDVGGKLTSVSIGGSLLGGSGSYDTLVVNNITHRGQIFAVGGIGAVKIGGDVLGGSGRASGTVWAGANDPTITIGSVAIGGSLVGGGGRDTGAIHSQGSIGPVTIAHSVVGGSANDAGGVEADGGALGNVTVGGSLIGGTGVVSGFLESAGRMGTIVIKGDVIGGAGFSSGVILAHSSLAKVSIGGSLIGGTADLSGYISSAGVLGAVSIGHDLLGGSIPAGGASLYRSGAIESEERIGSVFIGGSIVAGTDASGGANELFFNGSIRSGRDIGSLTVVGGLIGNVTPNGDSPVIISAVGPRPVVGATTDLAIGKISIGGRVEWARILAGYGRDLAPINADAQIGSVTVGADWIASSIAAGVQNLGADFVPGGTGFNADHNFGTAQDVKIQEAVELAGVKSRIASIVIAGQVVGTPYTFRGSDSFGFVAEQIGALKVGPRTFVLKAGAGDDGFRINERDDDVQFDAKLHELGASISPTITANSSAKLVNASTVTFQDADGDKVTVKFSKSLLTSATIANAVFHFDNGQVNDSVLAAQQLRYVDLRPLTSNGLGVTFTVVRSATGDGLVHVGAIESTGFDVGTVSIPGDLGYIDAGDANLATAGVASLAVRTLGRLSLDTQGSAGAGFTPSLQSDIVGRLGGLTVRQDIVDAFVNVSGSIGAVAIGGSLIGGADLDSGRINATGAIGAVKIGHHLQGGSAGNSGKISTTTGSIASVALGGSVLGGNGVRSGRIDAGASLGPVTIGHNVRGGTSVYSGGLGAEADLTSLVLGGSLLGGRGEYSGRIESEATLGPVRIAHNVAGNAGDAGTISTRDLVSIVLGGALLGGGGARSGAIGSSGIIPDGDIGTVKIAHEIVGGAGASSGIVGAYGKITSVSLGGSLLGGSGQFSGTIASETDTLAVRIGENLAGGAGSNSGNIFVKGKLHSVVIAGSFTGGAATLAGEIRGEAGIGTVKILGNLLGGAGNQTARIHAGGITLIEIGGSMVGGPAGNTAQIYTSGSSGIGALKILGSLIGGAGGSSAQVDCGGVLGSLAIGGSFVGGSANYSGEINGVQGIGTAAIGGSLYGGSIAGTTASQIGAGFLWSESGRIGSVTIGGSIVAGWDTSTGGALTRNASIRAADDLGAIVVKGSLIGNATSPVTIIARGQAVPGASGDVALASLTVGGSVERTEMLVGYDNALNFTNANAQVGAVKVTGDWVASNLSGAKRIAAIQIAGLVAGTASAFDAFSFQATQIGSFKSFGFTAPLTSGTDAPLTLSPTTGDVTLREG